MASEYFMSLLFMKPLSKRLRITKGRSEAERSSHTRHRSTGLPHAPARTRTVPDQSSPGRALDDQTQQLS